MKNFMKLISILLLVALLLVSCKGRQSGEASEAQPEHDVAEAVEAYGGGGPDPWVLDHEQVIEAITEGNPGVEGYNQHALYMEPERTFGAPLDVRNPNDPSALTLRELLLADTICIANRGADIYTFNTLELGGAGSVNLLVGFVRGVPLGVEITGFDIVTYPSSSSHSGYPSASLLGIVVPYEEGTWREVVALDGPCQDSRAVTLEV